MILRTTTMSTMEQNKFAKYFYIFHDKMFQRRAICGLKSKFFLNVVKRNKVCS